MAKVVDDELVIFEGDKYEMRGSTLVFIEGGEEDESFRIDSKTEEGD